MRRPAAATPVVRRTARCARVEYADAAEQARAALTRPHLVQRQVLHDAQQPRTEGLALAERADLAVGAHERLLRHVFRRRRVAQDEVRRTKGDLLVALDEHAERRRRRPAPCRSMAWASSINARSTAVYYTGRRGRFHARCTIASA